MGGSINMEQKGCESIGCWTHYVTLSLMSYELYLEFSRSNSGKKKPYREDQLTWYKSDVNL